MGEQRDRAVLNKYERDYERDKAKAEALEKKMRKGLSARLKKEEGQKGLKKQFSEDLAKMRDDPMAARRPQHREGFASHLEPDPTGWEKYPWDEEDED